MFHRKIDKPHQGLSPSMLAAIPSDESLDSDPDVVHAGDQPPESSSSSDSDDQPYQDLPS